MKFPSLSELNTNLLQTWKELVDIAKLISFRDVLLLLLIPLFCTALFLLPSNIHDSLKLDIKNPSWWQFFTSAYMHNGVDHITSNLTIYFLFVIFQFLVMAKLNQKSEYIKLLALLSVSFAIIGAIIQSIAFPILLPNMSYSEGLSGIVSGIIGFTPFILVLYASKASGKNYFDYGILNFVIFYIAFFLVLTYFVYVQNVLMLLLVLSLLILYAFWHRNDLMGILSQIRSEKKANRGFHLLLIFTFMLFLFAPLLTFPQVVIANGAFIDFFTHYLGLIYGGFLFFLYYKFFRKL